MIYKVLKKVEVYTYERSIVYEYVYLFNVVKLHSIKLYLDSIPWLNVVIILWGCGIDPLSHNSEVYTAKLEEWYGEDVTNYKFYKFMIQTINAYALITNE